VNGKSEEENKAIWEEEEKRKDTRKEKRREFPRTYHKLHAALGGAEHGRSR
jgi:hypothetical protein